MDRKKVVDKWEILKKFYKKNSMPEKRGGIEAL